MGTGEIDIVFMGMRPGEKLFEELQYGSEAIDKTRHPKIYIGKIAGLPPEELAVAVARLRELASAGSDLRCPPPRVASGSPRASAKETGRAGRSRRRLAAPGGHILSYYLDIKLTRQY
jgi:hypothetical protein